MKILAIDTTSRYLAVALSNGDKEYFCNLDLGIRHSALLVVTLQRALAALEMTFKDVDYFACGLGPGSFTGIRVGLSTVKGLAWAWQKKIVGIPTLDAIARNALSARYGFEDKKERGLIIPAIDAKRNLIYCSGYRCVRGALTRVMPYMLVSPQEFYAKLAPGAVLLGDALALYKESSMRAVKALTCLDRDYWYPQAHELLALAREAVAAGRVADAYTIKPIYLYPKECQIKDFPRRASGTK